MRSKGRAGIVDTYILRARVVPAFIGAAPGLALLATAIVLQPFSLPQAIASVAILVLFLVFADLARRFGKATEKGLFPTTKGQPFPTVLRHSDGVLDSVTKSRFLVFLASALGETAPSQDDERKDPASADAFYLRCGQWLRERTRDKHKFNLVFEENVVYGFRRNLYGLKPVGLVLNLLVVLVCIALLASSGWSNPQAVAVLVIAAVHGAYFLVVVTRASVLQASDQYGRQLVLACETLMRETSGKKSKGGA